MPATVTCQRTLLRQARAQAQGTQTPSAQALGLQRTSCHRGHTSHARHVP